MNTPQSNKRINPRVFLVLFLFGLFLSAIHPNDYFYWMVHLFPALIGFFLLIITYNRIRFSDFTYLIILIYSGIILEGAHFGSANVPLFVIIGEMLHESYNFFDKFSSFALGFTAAAIFREILVRRRVIRSGIWQFVMVASFAVSVSVMIEQINWIVMELIDDSFDFLISSQGSIRDVLLNIFCAMFGALSMLIFLGKVQYKRIRSKSQ
ncbi:MAG: DUF2238 domain-containing protein [Bacteroidales bacterium]